MTLTLDAPRLIGLVHLQNLVTDAAGTIQVTAGSYNSGIVSAWATTDQLELTALGRPRFFLFPAPVMTSSVTVNIAAGSGTISVGYLSASEIWQSPVNMDYGWSITVQDLADIQRVPFSSTYIIKRGKPRRLNLAVGFLRQGGIYGLGARDDHIFSQPLANALIAGKSSPIAVIPLPDDTANLERTSVWGLSTNDQPFANPFFATWATRRWGS